jgi:3-methyladenine DNA glycosylase Tag
VKPRVLFADLLRIGKLDIHGLLSLFDEAQQAIRNEKEIAATANNAIEVAALQKLSTNWRRLLACSGI